MIFPMIASVFLIIAIVCFLGLTPTQISDDLMKITTPKSSLREKARALRAGKKKKSILSAEDAPLYLEADSDESMFKENE